MPPFIEMNLGEDVQEKECAPEGEYSLVAADVKPQEYDIESDDGESGKGQYLQVRLDIEGGDHYKPVYHNLWLPTAFDDSDKSYNKQVSIKRFLHAAGIPFEESGFEPDDIRGARFDCQLVIEVDEDGKYPPKNALKLPSMPREAA